MSSGGFCDRPARLRRRLSVETLECRTVLATFVVTNVDDAGTGSLRDAVEQANLAAGPDVIAFDSSLSGSTIGITSGDMVILDGLSIEGPGAELLTVNAQICQPGWFR